MVSDLERKLCMWTYFPIFMEILIGVDLDPDLKIYPISPHISTQTNIKQTSLGGKVNIEILNLTKTLYLERKDCVGTYLYTCVDR